MSDKTDKELLEAIAQCAIAEYAAWKNRNLHRKHHMDFLHNFRLESGEYFDEEVDAQYHDDYFELKARRKEYQTKYATARAATRRCIVRAAAAMGDQE